MSGYRPDELFRSTAWYYARYRSEYPAEVFAFLAQRLRLDGTQQALDLGCGTGHVALPLAAHVADVIAVDPEAAMLDEGRQLAAERGVANVHWRRGDSFGLTELALPPLDLCTMGASFHWMDRPKVLEVLDGLVRPDGGVAVISGGAPGAGTKPAWDAVIAEVRMRWLGPTRRAGSGSYSHPTERHEDVLRASPFSALETWNCTRDLTRDLDSVVLAQFSYSYSAPALLGDDRGAFEADLREALRAFNPSGTFTESVRTEVLLATRP